MILLDTHIWLRWIIEGAESLPKSIETALHDTEALSVSAVTCWEVQMLAQRNKIQLPLSVELWLDEALTPSGVSLLPLDCEIARLAAALPEHHRDPADRMIIATAICHDARLASLDAAFVKYEELKGRLLAN